MSNTTDTPRKQGQRRRRRRGGKNRNNNNQNSNSSNRSQGKPGDGGGKRRRSRRKPIPLSWWQKALIAIGLYEDPNKRKGKGKGKKGGKTAPKSNTRNARSKDRAEKPKPDSTRKRVNNDRRRKGGDPSTVESSRVYVGNLSYDTTEEDLKELFKGVGNVRRVEIVYNRSTHRSKGYGFVEMINKEDAMRSVEVLHDQPFMGRNMTVSGAKSQGDQADEDQESSPEIKASDVELAPLPEKAEKSESESPAEPAEASAEPESADAPQEEERKQD